MLKTFIKNNKTLVAIILFILFYSFVQIIKPAFMYKKDGTIRDFGIGFRNKTIMPVWLFSIVLGILSYLIVIYYVEYLVY